MAPRMLVDSSFLFALQDRKDQYHAAATAFVRTQPYITIVPDVALTEVTQMLKKLLGEAAVLVFLDLVAANSPLVLEPVTKVTVARARAIMATYAGAKLDFVDCCIMALSEQLGITQVLTFDRRDFGIFRPVHCPYLELLPA